MRTLKSINICVFAVMVFLLTGCMDNIPMLKTGYKPASSEAARMAVPQTPSFGPPLHCMVEHGRAKFDGSWHDFEPSAFDVARGQRVQVVLSRSGKLERMTFLTAFNAAGQRMLFCPLDVKPDADNKVECASMYALEDDFKVGFKRTLDVPDAVRGGQIRCSYDRAYLKK